MRTAEFASVLVAVRENRKGCDKVGEAGLLVARRVEQRQHPAEHSAHVGHWLFGVDVPRKRRVGVQHAHLCKEPPQLHGRDFENNFGN